MAGITISCGRLLVTSLIGNHVPLLAIRRRFNGKAIVSRVTVITDHNYAANGNRSLEIDLLPCIAWVLLHVSGPIAVEVVASSVVGEVCGK